MLATNTREASKRLPFLHKQGQGAVMFKSSVFRLLFRRTSARRKARADPSVPNAGLKHGLLPTASIRISTAAIYKGCHI